MSSGARLTSSRLLWDAELKRLAEDLNTSVGNTVTLAVRALRQDRVGAELSTSIREGEAAWLDADLG